MSKDSESGGSGLLSKVVKFVKSPTTHWSDLDRPESTGSASESRLALKEMIERKRRNDFVRNREFDMLRKLRRRGSLRDSEAAAGPSFYPSSQPANTGERARTLKKIDEIEAQMSTAWSRRHQAAAPRPEAAQAQPPQPPAAADQAYARTRVVPLPEAPSAQRPTPPPAAAFAPTLTMDQTVDLPPLSSSSAEPVSVPSPVPAAPQPAAPVPAPVAGPGVRLLGDVAEFNVEVMAATRQDPEVEEAAIRFANGDETGAEAVLLDLVGEGGRRREDMDTWLTLFDLYRCAGEPTKFDDAAFDFAAIFGRSAPQWALITEPATAPAPMVARAPSPMRAGQFHWSSPSTLGAQSVVACKATLERHAPPWRIDWQHLRAIDPAALPGLIELLKQLADTQARVKFHAAEQLLDLLAERSPTDDRAVDPQWWLARLALLRLLNEMDEFELVALNYCVTYEVSPPAWEEPQSRFSPITEEGRTLPPSESAATEPPPEAAEPALGGATLEAGVLKASFEGEYIGTADEALAPLNAPGAATATAYEINCRKLLRMDFGAAGDLLNWCMAQQATGRSVTFKQVNRVVAAFFSVIGITDAARVMLRTD